MKKVLLFALVIGLLFTLTALWRANSDEHEDSVIQSEGPLTPAIDAVDSSFKRGSAQVRQRRFQSEERFPSSSSQSVDQQASRGSPLLDVIELGDEVYNPTSEEEANWLNEHGYPSAAMFEYGAMNFMDAQGFDEQTPFSAASLVKAESFALRFPDQSLSVIQYLERAATNGSIYALEALSRVHAQDSSAGSNVTSAAFLRAAEMRGNWALAWLRPNLGPEESFLAELYAHQILALIDQDRASAGKMPLARSPRPGLEEFLSHVETEKNNMADGD